MSRGKKDITRKIWGKIRNKRKRRQDVRKSLRRSWEQRRWEKTTWEKNRKWKDEKTEGEEKRGEKTRLDNKMKREEKTLCKEIWDGRRRHEVKWDKIRLKMVTKEEEKKQEERRQDVRKRLRRSWEDKRWDELRWEEMKRKGEETRLRWNKRIKDKMQWNWMYMKSRGN